MLTIGKIRGNATSEAADYYLNATKSSKEDYYVRSGEPAGVWEGAGCEALGLKQGQVVGEELRDLLDGFHSETGEALVQNAGKEKRVAAYDMTFSAGKDLSILAGVGDDALRQKIIDCHQSAVRRTMEFAQSNLAVTRRGKGGEEDEQVQGLAWANFNHMTSRGGEKGIDPLLHDHNLMINTVRRADGTFGSLDGKRLLDHKMAMGAMYRAELIKSVQRELGIELEVFEDRKGHYDFRIKGMTDQIRKEFSQRRDQIEAKLDEWKASKDDAVAAANATILTRQAKKAVDRDELSGQWRERAEAIGLTLDAVDKIMKATPEQAERQWIQDLAEKGLTDSEAQRAISDRVWAGVEDSGDFEGDSEALGMVEDELFDRYVTVKKRIVAANSKSVDFGHVIASREFALAEPSEGGAKMRYQKFIYDTGVKYGYIQGDNVKDVAALKKAVVLDTAYERLTDKNVRFSRQDVLKVIAEEAMKYGYDVDKIEQVNREIYATGELVKLGLDEKKQPIYSTKTMIEIEKSLQEKVAHGVNDHRHHIPRRVVQAEIDKFHKGKDWRLSDQQVESVLKITEGSGRISTINGSAGAGKSTSMNIVKQVYERQGYELIGCAIAGKAAAELQDGSGIKSQTIDSLLIELENGKRKLSEKTIIVMDEAGMVGSAQMNRILELTEKAAKEGKVIHTVLLGDTEQLQPVSAGPAFKLAQEELHRHGQETAILNEIRRQKDEWGRTAAHDFSAGRAAEGLAEYYSRDKIRFYEATEEGAKPADHRFAAIEGAVAAWQSDLSRYELSQNQMIALTNADVYTANFIAHEELKRAGAIGVNGHKVETEFGEREFVLGDRIIFRENENKNLNVKNGWTATITDISTNRDGNTQISVVCDNGEKRTFSTADYKKLDWSYAITTHASQGITKENTHILAGGSMTDLSSFYVQMSRHKENATIHIDHNSVHDIMLDAEPTERMIEYAEELAEKKEVELPKGYETDFWTCREFLNEHSPKQYEAKGDALDSEMSSKEIETLGMLAELASQDRKKESTLDYLENEADERNVKRKQEQDDPRSKLTMKERLQLAVRVQHDKDYDPNAPELPDFDKYEQQIIRRNASDKIYVSMATDKPLTQTEAYKEAAIDWMTTRVHERKSLVQQQAAREILAAKHQATKQAVLAQ